MLVFDHFLSLRQGWGRRDFLFVWFVCGGDALELAGAADKVGVAIQDASGRTVRSLSFGALPQGTSTFEWDGRNDAGERVAAGDYSLRLNATNASRAVVASGLVAGYVDSVTMQGGSSLLNLRGLGAADVSQVRRID